MDVGCSLWGFEASTMTLQHHSDSAIYPQFPKNQHLSLEAYQCKGAPGPTCPSTAYQGAKTPCIQMIWMWDAVCGALKPQQRLYNITWTQPYLQFPQIHTHPQRCISARVHPHVYPQHIKVLKHIAYIYNGCGLQSTGL